MATRDEKLEELISMQTAEFLNRNADRTSMITVTRTIFNRKSNRATIFITVLPDSAEDKALAYVERRRRDIQEFISKNIRLRTIPHLEISIDQGEKNREKIEEIFRAEKNNQK